MFLGASKVNINMWLEGSATPNLTIIMTQKQIAVTHVRNIVPTMTVNGR